MAKTKAELEAEVTRLTEENATLTANAATNAEGEKTVSELRTEIKRLTEENAGLREAETDKAVDAAVDSVDSGTCPNCGFNAIKHKELLKVSTLA